MEEMYEEVYSSLVDSGLAVKHETSYWRNEAGDIVELQQDAYGYKSKYELIHPSWLIVVDEVGSNTLQAKDGNVRGQMFLCMKDGQPQQRAATKDAHFTMLGFTSANGEPIMCMIIFTVKTMKDEWSMGFDPFAEWIGEDHEIEKIWVRAKYIQWAPNACSIERMYLAFVAALKAAASLENYWLIC
jgi:hypothetical protein